MPTAERALLHRGGRAGTWGSLGLWAEGDDDYADACAALATAVGRAAGVSRGDRVLSVACGAGDELRLWVQGFGAAQVTGIERDRGLVMAARRSFNGLAAVVDVRSGSGTDLLSLGLAAGSFDHVLCVDAAYHLRPRESFLQHAFLMLRPGSLCSACKLANARWLCASTSGRSKCARLITRSSRGARCGCTVWKRGAARRSAGCTALTQMVLSGRRFVFIQPARQQIVFDAQRCRRASRLPFDRARTHHPR